MESTLIQLNYVANVTQKVGGIYDPFPFVNLKYQTTQIERFQPISYVIKWPDRRVKKFWPQILFFNLANAAQEHLRPAFVR